MTIALILAFLLVGILQARALAKKKHWPDMAVYLVLMALSFAASVLLSMGVRLPNPIDAFQGLLEKLGLHY